VVEQIERGKSEAIEGDVIASDTTEENRPLVHPMSAICLIALDSLSGGGEILVTPTGVGLAILSAVLGVVSLIAVTVIEHGLNKKPLMDALGIGVTMGVLAAVPYPVVGTATGIAVLGWSGIKRLSG